MLPDFPFSMPTPLFLQSILTTGGIGCLAFTVFLVLMACSGIAAEMRDEEGNRKKSRSLKSILGGTLFLVFLIGILLISNIYLIQHAEVPTGIVALWGHAFGVFMIIHLYDLIVLDYLVIVRWHPDFLHLPDTPYYTKFKPHLVGFAKGIPLGIGASFLAALLALGLT